MKKNNFNPKRNEIIINTTRRDVFFDIIKTRFFLVMKVGFILFLFSIPLLLIAFLYDFNINVLYLKDLDELELLTQIINLKRITSFIKIFCYLIIAIGASGLITIIKKIVWAEPILFKNDFVLGLKQNLIHMMVLFFSLGVLQFIIIYFESILMMMTSIEAKYSIVYFMFYITFFLFILPLWLLVFSQTPFYKESFFRKFKNSVFIYGKKILPTLLIISILLMPFVLLLISSLTFKIIYTFILFLIIIPIASIGWLIYSSYLFDLFINQYNFPEVVGKGLICRK